MDLKGSPDIVVDWSKSVGIHTLMMTSKEDDSVAQTVNDSELGGGGRAPRAQYIREASTMKIFFVLIDLGLFPSQFSHAVVLLENKSV